MTDLDTLRASARDLSARRADVVAQAVDLAAQADAQRRAATAAAAAGDGAAATAAAGAAADLSGRRRDVLGTTAALDAELAGLVAALAGDPCDLESDVPLALLPVRLETRYSADGATLQVRIFPDDIHVDRLDRGLSDEERAAGLAYWQAVWDGSVTEDVAWQTLLGAVVPARAGWVAAALGPDLTTRPDPPVAGATPVVAAPPPRQQLPPTARALPDRFVVVAVQGDRRATATGAPVPPTLVVGLSPTADPDQLVRHGTLTLGPGMEWMADPDVARAVGMLVDVPLAAPGEPVETVVAVGVRAALDPAAGAAELAQLLESHRYAAGAAFVAPGTPTNNTETDRAAWTARPAPVPPPTRPPVPVAGGEAQVTAAAFGLDAASDTGLATWPGAAGVSGPLARAAHTALWQPTWGTFVERVVAGSMPTPTVDDALRESWRDWWQDDVRGGGPLPVLRLSDQPYGVLPVAAVDAAWQPDGDAPPLEAPLLRVLRGARPLVRAGLTRVPVLGDGALDDTLLEILGSAPHGLGLRVRSVGAEGLLDAAQLLWGIDPAGTGRAARDQLVETLLLQLGVGDALGLRGTVGRTTRPLGLPLVADDDADAGVVGDAAYFDALTRGAARTVASVLQALLEIAWTREQDDVDRAASDEVVGGLLDRGGPLLGADAQRLRELLDRARAGAARPGELRDTAARLDERFGASGPSALAAWQPVPAARTTLASVALGGLVAGAVAERVAVTALAAWLRARARQDAFRAAAQQLVDAEVGQRAHAVALTLDCASHRYDAWVSSLPTRRLASLRAASPTGVLIGAYGWVEGLTPGGVTTRAGGYVHAPSLGHAATAGVLRSGYLTHNRDAAGSGALAVDLSSARVRTAVRILDGVRSGQPLGALIGYLIERLLHERRLDVYTLSLRSLAPIAAGRTVPDAPPLAAQEAVAAGGVVDGVRLLALDRATVFARLATRPADNPDLDPATPWPAIADHRDALGAVLDEAARAYDAVSDVLVAESVHQLVLGNTARAAATMSAAAGGDVAPVDPDVVRTPTRAAALTHRVLVLLDDTAPGSGGWSAATPRALAEPRLAAWAENRLGPATAVVVHVGADGTRTTLDAAGLAALDVVHDAAGAVVGADGTLVAAALDARLRARLPVLGSDPLPVRPDPAWPAGLRAVGELAVAAAAVHAAVAGSRAVTPASFSRPNDPPARTVDAAALTARLQPLVAALGATADALDTALAADPPDPAAVQAAVDDLRGYGIALPAGGGPAARAVLAEARTRAAAAAAVPAPHDAEAAARVGEALFGRGFAVLAPVTGAADLFAATFGGLTPSRAALRRWLLDLATVRPGLSRWTATLLLGDAAGAPLAPARALRVAQLAPSGAPGTATWLGSPLPDGSPAPDQPVTDVVVEAPAGYDGTAPVAGFVVDEWVEQLPRRAADGSATVTTGLAVNADAPGARAPQAVLLAVSADGSRWSTDGLVALLAETRELARLRAVTLERIATPSPVLPAIQEQSWSLQGQPVLDLSMLVTSIARPERVLPYVGETGP